MPIKSEICAEMDHKRSCSSGIDIKLQSMGGSHLGKYTGISAIVLLLREQRQSDKESRILIYGPSIYEKVDIWILDLKTVHPNMHIILEGKQVQ